MKSPSNSGTMQTDTKISRVFSVLFGAVLGLSLVKFGNPSILEWRVNWPNNGSEWLFSAWPVVIGWWLLAGVVLLGIFVHRKELPTPWWLVVLPLVWLLWQFISATQTLDARLTAVTLRHFTACVVCFYLGLFCLSRVKDLTGFWLCMLAGFAFVLAIGMEQHFGGLEATRQHFWLYVYPTLKEVPAEYVKRMSSDRIFSTLFYPNTLAGAVLLYLPVALGFVWCLERWFTAGARVLLMVLVGAPALACLYWSGSKGGWLLMLLMGLLTLLQLRFERKWKVALVALMLVAGLSGFAVRFAGYFQKGATSVNARFDYWRAAARTAASNPMFGAGPGTFAISYKKIKKPESEMTRLVHSDYLEQASDSGIAGCLLYTAFIVGALFCTAPRTGMKNYPLRFAVWLGLLGWALQSAVEFDLYIPALAWSCFGLMGWLAGSIVKPIDKSSVSG